MVKRGKEGNEVPGRGKTYWIRPERKNRLQDERELEIKRKMLGETEGQKPGGHSVKHFMFISQKDRFKSTAKASTSCLTSPKTRWKDNKCNDVIMREK